MVAESTPRRALFVSRGEQAKQPSVLLSHALFYPIVIVPHMIRRLVLQDHISNTHKRRSDLLFYG